MFQYIISYYRQNTLEKMGDMETALK